jgi:hypothetical protein
MPTYAQPPPQDSLESSKASIIRKVAIMHDKLNDAVEIVNYSFSYEVKSPVRSLCLTSLLGLRDFFSFLPNLHLRQLLPGMVSTGVCLVFTAFLILQVIRSPGTCSITRAMVFGVWCWFILIFLIACIHIADSTTKTVSTCMSVS